MSIEVDLAFFCLNISNKSRGVIQLGMGSDFILIFDKGEVAGADKAWAQSELERIRKGLARAGAKQVCSLDFGGGYFLLVRPMDASDLRGRLQALAQWSPRKEPAAEAGRWDAEEEAPPAEEGS